MNRQPYGIPPRRWDPQLNVNWVKWSQSWRANKLRKQQRIEQLEIEGEEHLQAARANNSGILITPNHSTHYDSAALYIAGDRLGMPLYFMAAWQVFEMSSRYERWALTRLGCFSVDREGNDRHAFKVATEILQSQPHPLVIFPEGDIYHVTDVVTPFREGAAGIALAAAKRAEKPICIVPCGIKFWYLDNPMPELLATMDKLEERVLLRTNPTLDIRSRIYRLAEGVIALKELDYLGHTASGELRDRMRHLSDRVLADLEERHGLASGRGGKIEQIPVRAKTLRQHLIKLLAEKISAYRLKKKQSPTTWTAERFHHDPEVRALCGEMDDVFFAMQVYSYPGNYLRPETPSIERIAETIDKLEEDILQLDLPTVRGRRRIRIRFGEPIPVSGEKKSRRSTEELTGVMHSSVQELIQGLNQDYPSTLLQI